MSSRSDFPHLTDDQWLTFEELYKYMGDPAHRRHDTCGPGCHFGSVRRTTRSSPPTYCGSSSSRRIVSRTRTLCHPINQSSRGWPTKSRGSRKTSSPTSTRSVADPIEIEDCHLRWQRTWESPPLVRGSRTWHESGFHYWGVGESRLCHQSLRGSRPRMGDRPPFGRSSRSRNSILG